MSKHAASLNPKLLTPAQRKVLCLLTERTARIVCGEYIRAGLFQFVHSDVKAAGSPYTKPRVNVDSRTLERLRVFGLIKARVRRVHRRDTDYVLTDKGRATARRCRRAGLYNGA